VWPVHQDNRQRLSQLRAAPHDSAIPPPRKLRGTSGWDDLGAWFDPPELAGYALDALVFAGVGVLLVALFVWL
jgi:hypothetical protein